MSTATLSFRASTEFAEQTKALAGLFNLPSSEYLRDAVREKNEHILKEPMTFLSQKLSAQHLLENEAMNATTSDGLAQSTAWADLAGRF